MRLDRGDRERVQAGMPVLTADGLVGQVRRTWGRNSDVLLVADKTSAIDVVVQRTGARGMLHGTGSAERYACRARAPLARGRRAGRRPDRARRASASASPRRSWWAASMSSRKKEFGLYQEATVVPAVNFSRLDEVLILTSGSRARGHGRRGRERRAEKHERGLAAARDVRVRCCSCWRRRSAR